jgi:hypothetical protein
MAKNGESGMVKAIFLLLVVAEDAAPTSMSA